MSRRRPASVSRVCRLGLTFVDFDHDGDLDLYISRFTRLHRYAWRRIQLSLSAGASPGNVLWRNNGDGTFTDWTAQSGLAGDAPGIAALASDLNNDRAVDLILTGWRRAAAVLDKSCAKGLSGNRNPGIRLSPRRRRASLHLTSTKTVSWIWRSRTGAGRV